MRLTAIEQRAYGLPNFQISVDGKPVDKVVMFDTDNNVVERFVTDENGTPVIEGECYKTETLKGVVSVRVVKCLY